MVSGTCVAVINAQDLIAGSSNSPSGMLTSPFRLNLCMLPRVSLTARLAYPNGIQYVCGLHCADACPGLGL